LQNRVGRSEPDRENWKKAYNLFVQAFRTPKDAMEQKRLNKILKKPLPPEIEKDFFEYDPGFMKNLGRMSLSLSYTYFAFLSIS
jgi:hypothetical protein